MSTDPIPTLLQTSSSPFVRASQARQWTDCLFGVARDVVKNGVQSEYLERFCREFYAVLKDIGPEYKSIGLHFGATIPPDLQPLVQQIEQLDGQAKKLIAEMRAQLSRQDAIVIEYLRHCACHVFQDDYLDKFLRAGRGKTVGILDSSEPVPISDVAAAIETNIRNHGPSGEHRFCVEIARTALPKIDQLLTVFESLPSPCLQLVNELAARNLIQLPRP
ncbi:hypothetical protein HPC49_05555 [Pyxidicoccus fallax]|uniref:Uncharacterized protein n=1 Tax=Pyxidicoccus fallax TaxID=394095 RepID=A0A848LIE3_9BACT|nr:hypothetical protein [Pyxidicoccus fallax]NMO17485.1 hypothetical protein [Pyxidicoccus fallax]NPC77720.1 hypothetical protein [Pyxidicoccus fallax]